MTTRIRASLDAPVERYFAPKKRFPVGRLGTMAPGGSYAI